jgi:DNA-directed RNA polymerase specialized sigma24 family protein
LTQFIGFDINRVNNQKIGERNMRESLVDSIRSIAIHEAQKIHNLPVGLEREDLVQEACIRCLSRLDSVDFTIPAKAYGYFRQVIRRHYLNLVKASQTQKRKVVLVPIEKIYNIGVTPPVPEEVILVKPISQLAKSIYSLLFEGDIANIFSSCSIVVELQKYFGVSKYKVSKALEELQRACVS